MKLENLRSAVVEIVRARQWGDTAPNAAVDAISPLLESLTDPTPVDDEWLDARWECTDRTEHCAAWRLHDLADVKVWRLRGPCRLVCGYHTISENATRGDVVRLLWGLRVAIPEVKGGE